MPSILESANAEAIKEVRERTPSQFTVGGYVRNGKLVGGVTYDRAWTNGWGLTAYARAYWDDLPVSVKRPKGEAGVELVKRF
jgi:hypothetical protein